MTLDRSAAGELERPIESFDDLVDFFRDGEKRREHWRLGLEHENLGVDDQTFGPVAFEGERGIEALLHALAGEGGWKPVTEAGRLVALDRDGESITLEPGGQLELSGRPHASAAVAAREFRDHLSTLLRVSRRFGVAWLGLGMQPLFATDAAPRVPKERYRIMRSYLPVHGSLALDMMHVTASVQVSFDFSDETDMVSKLRTALACAPIADAIYANSSLADGRPTGFVSKRMMIWRATDPARCGGIPFAFDASMGYARYAEWALDVPMFFVLRDGRYLPAGGKTFGRFLAEGHEGLRATLADWNRHLTTVFPDVRVKRVIEVRGADSGSADLVCSVPAFWKGILYDADAREAAFALTEGWSAEQREQAYLDVARFGLAAESGGRKVLDLARELLDVSRRGLVGSAADPEEVVLLEPVANQLALGKSPGQALLEAWEGPFERSADRLIRATRY